MQHVVANFVAYVDQIAAGPLEPILSKMTVKPPMLPDAAAYRRDN